MYNCTNHQTGSAVARVTKDRAARRLLPSTVQNQLGRRRQLLTIAQWNVRTLIDREAADRPERRTALVATELAKYNIDIAALCETMFSESDSFNDLEYSFFWSGKPEGERREAGVGLAIKKDIVTKLTEMPRPVSDRIMTMRLPLSTDNFATIISVYAPTMTNPDKNKEALYNHLASVLSGIPHTDKLLLIGDLNARIGRDNDKCRGRNNSKISGSQQDCLIEKSGSPQSYLAVLKMAQTVLSKITRQTQYFKIEQITT